MAVGGDLALPEVEGNRSLMLRLTNTYVERLLQVAEQDPVVAAAFNEVADLLARPQNIMRLRVLWRVLRGPRPRAQTRAAASPTGSLPRSAIVDAMSARAAELRSGARSQSGAKANAQGDTARRG
jgi:hypothetical protein